MKIVPIKALSDNYIWMVIEDNRCVVVDPGEAQPVLEFVQQQQLSIEAIVLTHNHHDHVDGVDALHDVFSNAMIYGPSKTKTLHVVKDGDVFQLLGKTWKVYKTAGHTHEHVSYLVEDDILFSGDALFAGGCGRVFTGDYLAQFQALSFFKTLPDNVQVYAGHEYTLTNLKFGLTIEPENKFIREKINKLSLQSQRSQSFVTLPSSIKDEKQTNVLLRAKTVAEFKELRDKRDSF